jgi:hypothetical protein
MKISSRLANNFDCCSTEKNKLLRRKLTGIRLVEIAHSVVTPGVSLAGVQSEHLLDSR